MGECNKSSYSYDSSPILGSTNNIIWTGDEIPCLGICTGDRLTTMQNKIAEKLCEVIGEVDVSELIIPDCLKTAWGTNNPVVYEFIQFLLDQLCEQNTTIVNLSNEFANYNPTITVNYPPCCENVCLDGQTLTISQHFEKVLTCLCNLQSQVDSLQSDNEALTLDVNNLQATVSTLSTTVSTLLTNVTNLQIQVDACCS